LGDRRVMSLWACALVDMPSASVTSATNENLDFTVPSFNKLQ
jgi:hypothetical protein